MSLSINPVIFVLISCTMLVFPLAVIFILVKSSFSVLRRPDGLNVDKFYLLVISPRFVNGTFLTA